MHQPSELVEVTSLIDEVVRKRSKRLLRLLIPPIRYSSTSCYEVRALKYSVIDAVDPVSIRSSESNHTKHETAT